MTAATMPRSIQVGYTQPCFGLVRQKGWVRARPPVMLARWVRVERWSRRSRRNRGD